MKLIIKYLKAESILLDLEVTSKKRVFEQVGLFVENHFHIARADIYTSLFEREKLGSTGLGHGVAVPHGRVNGLKDPIILFVRLKTPIPFEAPDQRPVSLMMFLLMPDSAHNQHLMLLAEVAQMFSESRVRQRLQDAANPEDVLAVLRQGKDNGKTA